MEIALAVFSWVFTIAFVLGLVSVPLSLVLEKTVKGWRGSKGEKIYKYVQYSVLGLALATFMVTVGLMLG